ncbi:MAG TPA: potassium-transporting ATPase subunit F [Acidimicrobiia bacterium]|nr:potassium-transporting ATPase subunit F [Acidimicrobiia bacterium]
MTLVLGIAVDDLSGIFIGVLIAAYLVYALLRPENL